MNTQATDKQKANFDSLCDFIDKMSILENSFSSYFDPADIDETTTASEICRKLEDSEAFNVEIIYYSRAMEYLLENDPSLVESMTLADDFGYSPANINSELLATLLASENARKDWYEAEDEVQDFLDGLDWEEDEEEDEGEDEED